MARYSIVIPLLIASAALAQEPAPPEERILAAAVRSDRAYENLRHLTDRIGARIAGSRQLEEANRWARELLENGGADRAVLERVMVPNWVRGAESAELVSPVRRPLHLLGLGGSIGTSPRGLTAKVVVVDSFEALDALPEDDVKGRIVVYNVEMPTDRDPFAAYGSVYPYRSEGASRAAKRGAVASLVRSLTTHSLQTPHTGRLSYEEGVRKIPSAAITVEDAKLLQRLQDAGARVRVRLRMGARMKGMVASANVVAQLTGREKPEEIVLIGAHLDSWDVGSGAWDDGAGVVTSMEAILLLSELGLRPRRTIRVVLFTNEENGRHGSLAYWKAHHGDHHVAAIESDRGAGRPKGFTAQGDDALVAAVALLATPLQAIGAGAVRAGFAGVDVIPLADAGIPTLGLDPDATKYFDYHHTDADTFDKIVPEDLALQVAAMATMAWLLAESEETLPVQKVAAE